MKACLIIAGLLMTVGLIPFMGIPGAIVFELCFPVLRLIYGEEAQRRYVATGPSLWGAAIWITLIWPPMLPILWWVVGEIRPFNEGWPRVVNVSIGLYLWGLLLTYICYTGFKK